MSNYIFDIKSTMPTQDDIFFVDTNVWFWLTYASSKSFPQMRGAPLDYQTTHYPNFIQKALDANSQLYYSPLSLAELANTIENIEFQLYKYFQQGNASQSRKVFRKIKSERKAITREVDAAWSTITTLSNVLNIELNNQLSEDSLSIFKRTTLDPYDAFFYEMMKAEGISKIITDDSDFDSTDGIEIYTANDRLIPA